jgi:hypothetical protein
VVVVVGRPRGVASAVEGDERQSGRSLSAVDGLRVAPPKSPPPGSGFLVTAAERGAAAGGVGWGGCGEWGWGATRPSLT